MRYASLCHEVVLMRKRPASPCPAHCPLRMSTGDPSPGEGLVVPATVRPQGFLVGLSGPATPHEGLGKHPWKLGPHLPSTSLALKLCV